MDNAGCKAHSGMMVWIRVMVLMASCSSGLLAYSVLWQAPSIRLEVATEIARLGIEVQKNTDGLCALGRRVTLLENR